MVLPSTNSYSTQIALVAQGIEHKIPNLGVACSNHAGGTKLYNVLNSCKHYVSKKMGLQSLPNLMQFIWTQNDIIKNKVRFLLINKLGPKIS